MSYSFRCTSALSDARTRKLLQDSAELYVASPLRKVTLDQREAECARCAQPVWITIKHFEECSEVKDEVVVCPLCEPRVQFALQSPKGFWA